MNEEQVNARMAEMDAALEGVPGEAREAVYQVYEKLLGEHAGALKNLDEAETQLSKVKDPDELTKESILAIKDPKKRVAAIRENPHLIGPNAEQKKYTSKAEIMAIKDPVQRINQITANPELFKTGSFTPSNDQEFKQQFQ